MELFLAFSFDSQFSGLYWGFAIIPILQIWKLSPRETKELTQVYRAGIETEPKEGEVSQGSVAGSPSSNTFIEPFCVLATF